jgi:hypothetical protein
MARLSACFRWRGSSTAVCLDLISAGNYSRPAIYLGLPEGTFKIRSVQDIQFVCDDGFKKFLIPMADDDKKR